MAKVIIKCEYCDKKRPVTKRLKRIIGNQCVECFHRESSEEHLRKFYNGLYN